MDGMLISVFSYELGAILMERSANPTIVESGKSIHGAQRNVFKPNDARVGTYRLNLIRP